MWLAFREFRAWVTGTLRFEEELFRSLKDGCHGCVGEAPQSSADEAAVEDHHLANLDYGRFQKASCGLIGRRQRDIARGKR